MDRLVHASNSEATHHRYFDDVERLKLSDPSYYPDFWLAYCDAVIDHDKSLRLGETIDRHTPVIISLKFRLPSSGSDSPRSNEGNELDQNNKKYVDDHSPLIEPSLTKKLAKLLLQTVRQFLLVKDDQLYCAVLMSDPYSSAQHRSLDLRLQLPLVLVPYASLRELHLKYAKVLRQEGIYELLPVGIEEPILEELPARNSNAIIPMYGSITSEGTHPVELIEVFTESGANLLGKIELIFPVTLHRQVKQYPGMEEFVNKRANKYTYYLPLIFSVEYGTGAITGLRPEVLANRVHLDIKKQRYQDESIVLAYELLPMINPESYADDEVATTIGMAIYNLFSDIGHADAGLEVWSSCCRQNPKYKKYELEEFKRSYLSFSNARNPYTERTLFEYALIDNYDLANTWQKTRFTKAMRQLLQSSSPADSLARVFFVHYWRKYLYVEGQDGGDQWYAFTNGIIKRVSTTELLSTLVSEFKAKLVAYGEELDGGDANRKRSDIKVMKGELEKVVNGLGKSLCQSTFIKNIKLEFYKVSRHAVLNADRNCMATSNGWVLVRTKGKGRPTKWRRGKLEDCITKSSGAPFYPEMTEHSPQVKAYDHFKRQNYRTKEERDCNLQFCTWMMISHNKVKKVRVVEGRTDVGKSTQKQVEELVFGTDRNGYSFTLTSTSATGARGHQSGPTPELAHMEDCKSANIQELEDSDNMNEGFVKEVSGGDNMFARFNRKDGGNFMSSCMLSFWVNRAPRFAPHAENKGRLFIDRPAGRFVKPELAPATEEEQWQQYLFPKKDLSDEEMMNLAIGMLWRMVHTPLPEEPTLELPEVVIKNTEKYWDRTDFYTIFIKQNLTAKEGARVKEALVYSTFRDWMYQNYNGIKFNHGKYLDCMQELVGDVVRDEEAKVDYFIGYRLRGDLYDKFKEECCREDKTTSISIPKMYREFCVWYRTFYSEGKVPNRDLFQEYMGSLLGTPKPRIGFVGWTSDAYMHN